MNKPFITVYYIEFPIIIRGFPNEIRDFSEEVTWCVLHNAPLTQAGISAGGGPPPAQAPLQVAQANLAVFTPRKATSGNRE